MTNLCYFLLSIFPLFYQSIDSQNDTIPQHPFGEYREEVCDKISVVNQAVVVYESSSLLYLKIEGKQKIESYDINIVINGKENKAKFTSNYELILDHLPLNSTIDVAYIDGCGNKSSLTYTTRPSPATAEGGVTVSRKIMDALKKLYVGKDDNVVRFFEQDNTLHYYEKLSFIQNTLLHGKAIADNQPFGFYPDASLMKLGGNCSCVFLVMQSDFAPGDPISELPGTLPTNMEGTPANTGYISSYDETISADWSNNDNEGNYTHNVYSKGAARNQDTWANGRRIHTRTASKMVGGKEISPNYAYVGISWFCFRDGHVEDGCGCRKRVNYTATYNTRLRSSMSLPNCFLCGSKSGKAKAEDWAFLALTNEADFVDVLAAGNATVETEMNKTYNPEFLINYIEVIAALAPVLVASDDITEVFLAQVDNIVEKVTEFIQTPYVSVNSSSNKDASIALIQKEGSFQITPNEVWYLKMFSFGNTDVEGATSWNGAARIASSFKLGVAVREGIDQGQIETCCTLGGSCWICSSFPDAPVLSSTYLHNLSTFFYLHNTGFTYNEYGTFWKKGGCVPGWGKLEQNSSFLNQESKHYYIYDLLGKLHFSGEVSSLDLNNFLRAEIFNKQLSSGIYLLSVVSKDGKHYSQKIFIP